MMKNLVNFCPNLVSPSDLVQARCAAMAFDPSFFSSAYRLDRGLGIFSLIWCDYQCQESQDQRSLEA